MDFLTAKRLKIAYQKYFQQKLNTRKAHKILPKTEFKNLFDFLLLKEILTKMKLNCPKFY